jgi:acyl-coenzyme A thioesterase PaaI-like protein
MPSQCPLWVAVQWITATPRSFNPHGCQSPRSFAGTDLDAKKDNDLPAASPYASIILTGKLAGDCVAEKTDDQDAGAEAPGAGIDPIVSFFNNAMPFAKHVGVKVVCASNGEAEALLPDHPDLLNHIASQHAAALFAVAEVASGAAMASVFADLLGSAVPLVREASISYKKIARGTIRARAFTTETVDDIRKRFYEAGRALFNIEVKLHRLDGVEVAVASFSWSIRGNAPGVTQRQLS